MNNKSCIFREREWKFTPRKYCKEDGSDDSRANRHAGDGNVGKIRVRKSKYTLQFTAATVSFTWTGFSSFYIFIHLLNSGFVCFHTGKLLG